MLTKRFCKLCHDSSRSLKWDKNPAKERNWARGKVACIALFRPGLGADYYPIEADPPGCCHYLLEQLLASQ